MAISPALVLDRVTGGRGDKALRYSMVSVVGVVITQVLLVLLHAVLGVDATASNVLAVCISAGPVFVLNKRWVWGKEGRAHVRRELVPFWGFTLVGLALSSGLVAAAQHYSHSTLVVMVANLTGFGIVWIAKFLFLDSVVFPDEAVPADG
jgi:putative flippase GtrA